MTAQPTTKISGFVAQDTEKPPEMLTVEQFLALYPGDEPYELLEGIVIEVPSPKPPHGDIDSFIIAQLRVFVDSHKLGKVLSNTGFRLSRKTVIAPDSAFVSYAKWKTITDPEDYYPFAPDLAVEIISPSNTANEIATKVQLYLDTGAALVWVIYPKLKKVIVHRPDHTSFDVLIDGILTGGDILPGLTIPLLAIFPPDELETQEGT